MCEFFSARRRVAFPHILAFSPFLSFTYLTGEWRERHDVGKVGGVAAFVHESRARDAAGTDGRRRGVGQASKVCFGRRVLAGDGVVPKRWDEGDRRMRTKKKGRGFSGQSSAPFNTPSRHNTFTHALGQGQWQKPFEYFPLRSSRSRRISDRA